MPLMSGGWVRPMGRRRPRRGYGTGPGCVKATRKPRSNVVRSASCSPRRDGRGGPGRSPPARPAPSSPPKSRVTTTPSSPANPSSSPSPAAATCGRCAARRRISGTSPPPMGPHPATATACTSRRPSPGASCSPPRPLRPRRRESRHRPPRLRRPTEGRRPAHHGTALRRRPRTDLGRRARAPPRPATTPNPGHCRHRLGHPHPRPARAPRRPVHRPHPPPRHRPAPL